MNRGPDRTSRMRSDFKKRADIVAYGDDRRAEVYRDDVKFAETEETRRYMPKPERRQLAAWVYAQYEAGRRCTDIANELGVSMRQVSGLRHSHLIYEAKDRLLREQEEKK